MSKISYGLFLVTSLHHSYSPMLYIIFTAVINVVDSNYSTCFQLFYFDHWNKRTWEETLLQIPWIAGNAKEDIFAIAILNERMLIFNILLWTLIKKVKDIIRIYIFFMPFSLSISLANIQKIPLKQYLHYNSLFVFELILGIKVVECAIPLSVFKN